MEIQPIFESDLKAIEKLERQNYTNPYSFEMLEEIISNKLFTCNKLLKNKVIIGYFFVMLVIDKLEIIKLTVDKSQQGNGYGEFLLKNIIVFAENSNCTEILLEVNEKNNTALKLYQKYDFRCLSKIVNYYDNNEDGLLMSKQM